MESHFSGIVALSWNFQNHDLKLLSRFICPEEVYSNAKLSKELNSMVFISTCNRAEIYLHFANSIPPNYKSLKSALKNTPFSKIIRKSAPTIFYGKATLTALFQLVSGLRSMALGETQIVDQVRKSYEDAQKADLVDFTMQNIFETAFRVQRKIRSTTQFPSTSLLSLIEQELNEPIDTDTAIVGGTGNMSRKSIRFLIGKGVTNFLILRQSQKTPSEFKSLVNSYKKNNIDFNYSDWKKFSSFHELNAGIMISSTQSKKPLISCRSIDSLKREKILSQNAQIVDLGLPPNISGESPSLINLKSLMKISEKNQNIREKVSQEAQPEIERGITQYWLDEVYRSNPNQIATTFQHVEEKRRYELSELLDGPLKNLSQKQKRILQDYINKRERKALRVHKNLFLDLLTKREFGR